MDDRRLNFGPRYDAELNRVHEDGSPADPDDVGFEVTWTEDEGLTAGIGGKYTWKRWPLTPDQAQQLAAFLVGL